MNYVGYWGERLKADGGKRITYFVTDVECDGPDPSRNSMISFASVAVDIETGICGQFEANLLPRPDRVNNARTMAWWLTQPAAYAAATLNPALPEKAMKAFADWVETFSGERIFAARPLMFDGSWIDEYLKSFVGSRVMIGPYDGRQIFTSSGLDIESYLSGLFGWRFVRNCIFPDDWLGNIQHTHRAIDDATGYANALYKALKIGQTQPRKEEDFLKGGGKG